MKCTVSKPRAKVLALIAALISTCVVAQAQPGTVLWSYDTGSWVLSAPALASDGTLYLGTYAGLAAVTNNSTSASNKWVFAPAVGLASQAIAEDGTVYCSSNDGKLYAIKEDGSGNCF